APAPSLVNSAIPWLRVAQLRIDQLENAQLLLAPEQIAKLATYCENVRFDCGDIAMEILCENHIRAGMLSEIVQLLRRYFAHGRRTRVPLTRGLRIAALPNATTARAIPSSYRVENARERTLRDRLKFFAEICEAEVGPEGGSRE